MKLKACPKCQQQLKTRDVRVRGRQEGLTKEGPIVLLLVDHVDPNCGTTLVAKKMRKAS